MALIAVNAQNYGTDYVAQTPLHSALIESSGPIVIMIHGLKYTPFTPKICPHRFILSLTPDTTCSRALSWPRHLGFTVENTPLAIGFGWPAGHRIRAAYRTAKRVGIALAQLIAEIKRTCPTRPVQIITHSLGARVFFAALPHLPAHSIGRAVIMSGAELCDQAQAAMATPAGQTLDLFNITSRENDLYDCLLEYAVAPLTWNARAIGAGLGGDVNNWVDIQMDHDGTLVALGKLGFRIAEPTRRICHWSSYIRPGMFPFYRYLLRAPKDLPLDFLKSQLPIGTTSRWSRILVPSVRIPGLPFR